MRSLALLAATVAATCLVHVAAVPSQAPFTALWSPDDVTAVRAGVRKGRDCLAAPAAALAARADDAMRNLAAYGPWTVMNKKVMPPSGSKHSYESLDKYYWPCNAPPLPPPPTQGQAPAVPSPAASPQHTPPRSWLLAGDTPDPLCEHGIEHHSDTHPSVCCLASCGACGGAGCETFPGGKAGCCVDGVIAGNRSCDSHSAPCVLDAQPCDQATGLPYYRHDGQVNPASADYDHDDLENMTEAVMALGPAAYLAGSGDSSSGDSDGGAPRGAAWAATAASIVRTWFTDPATSMNPDMQFGHFIPGVVNGSHGALIDTHWFPELLDAVSMLGYVDAPVAGAASHGPAGDTGTSSGATWSKGDALALRGWFAAYLKWMTTDPMALQERNASNNHGIWYDVQVLAAATHIGWGDFGSPDVVREDPKFGWARDIATDTAAQFGPRRIDVQVKPDGELPAEEARTKALSYCEFAVDALFHAGALVDTVARVTAASGGGTGGGGGGSSNGRHSNLGSNLGSMSTAALWSYNHSAIQRVLDWQLPYVVRNKTWPFQQIVPFFPPNCTESMVDQCASTYFWPVRKAARVGAYASGSGYDYEGVLSHVPGLDAGGTYLNMLLPAAACLGG